MTQDQFEQLAIMLKNLEERMDMRFDAVDRRFDDADRRFENVAHDIAELRTEIAQVRSEHASAYRETNERLKNLEGFSLETIDHGKRIKAIELKLEFNPL